MSANQVTNRDNINAINDLAPSPTDNAGHRRTKADIWGHIGTDQDTKGTQPSSMPQTKPREPTYLVASIDSA